jgi:hypothetical protein
MAKCDQIAGLFSWATVARTLRSLRLGRTLAALVLPLTLTISQRSIVLSQSPTPAKAKNEVNQTSVLSSQTEGEDAHDAQDSQVDDKAAPKKEKRGSLVIAPIPISSPAFGSGLLLIAGYVFKLNEQDKSSPPSWLGAAGAITNNGSRGLILGGRLYVKENKYQTTFAAGRDVST